MNSNANPKVKGNTRHVILDFEVQRGGIQWFYGVFTKTMNVNLTVLPANTSFFNLSAIMAISKKFYDH